MASIKTTTDHAAHGKSTSTFTVTDNPINAIGTYLSIGFTFMSMEGNVLTLSQCESSGVSTIVTIED